jgi:hypothetical protein
VLAVLRPGELAGRQLPGGSAVLAAVGWRILTRRVLTCRILTCRILPGRILPGRVLPGRVLLGGRIQVSGRVRIRRRVRPAAADARTLRPARLARLPGCGVCGRSRQPVKERIRRIRLSLLTAGLRLVAALRSRRA